MALRTWVSGPQREVSGPESQDLGFRPSVFGSQDLGFRTSKALHPTVVLSFSHHFSLCPPSLFFFPSLFSASTVTFLYVQWSQTDAHTDCILIHRQDRSAIENAGRFCRWIKTQNRRVKQTDARTHGLREFIYTSGCPWPKATVKPLCEIQVPKLRSHILKIRS